MVGGGVGVDLTCLISLASFQAGIFEHCGWLLYGHGTALCGDMQPSSLPVPGTVTPPPHLQMTSDTSAPSSLFEMFSACQCEDDVIFVVAIGS